MKDNVSKYNKCANCGACVNICPVNAIHVRKDTTFYSICVDENKCIQCRKCTDVCPVNNPHKTQSLLAGYAGYVDDHAVLYSSSSGGLFHAIAQSVIDKGGVVYGASYTDDCHSVVFASTDEVSLHCLQKSKYVESDIADTFRKIRLDLNIGREVAFCGTPCQAAGLKRFLGKEYEKLIICDFSCGGLPSHRLFDEYLKNLEKRYKSDVKIVDFRPKNYGWENYSIFVEFKNGMVYTKLATLDPYYKAFLHSLSKRDYCYQCDFADNHAADIILADFWLYKTLSDIDNRHRGISLVLTNSPKGQNLMAALAERIVMKEIPLEKASYNIKSGHLPEVIVQRHNQFMTIAEKEGMDAAINKLQPTSIQREWKQILKQFIMRGKYEGSEEDRA